MRILIAIHGSYSRPEQMEAQRNTWLRDLKTDHRFFLGNPDLPLAAMPPAGTSVAMSDLADNVVYLDMPDGPNVDPQRAWQGHRTPVCQRKTEALCRYAFEHGYDYVLKCDDDTYVRPVLLLESDFENYDYVGRLESHYAADIGFYKFANGGAGYWLSREAMKLINQHGLNLVPIEDYAVGQLLARNDIRAEHDEHYCPTLEPCGSEWFTVHQAKSEDMYRLYSQYANEQPKEKEPDVRLPEPEPEFNFDHY